MKLVMTLDATGPPDLVDAQVAFHLNAGVDLVLAADRGKQDETAELLRSYERDGYVRLARVDGEPRTALARLAATAHGADWVFNADAAEFWWPRGGGLREVLAAIPRRYTIVQGLPRVFLPSRDTAGPLLERTTNRKALGHGPAPSGRPLAQTLRPAHRGDPEVVVGDDGRVSLPWNMPLRAWYPLEVLQLPLGDAAPAAADDASVVEDTRLRDALRTLHDGAAGRTFALPVDGESRLAFPAPDIVDDAAYAVECAAVGEVDLPRLEQYIAELEQRVAALEQRLWPRVVRNVSRLARRSR